MTGADTNGLPLPSSALYQILQANSKLFAPVVPFNPQSDVLLLMDFTASNTQLTDEILLNTDVFTTYINGLLQPYTYGVGGYNELRTIYSRSAVFNDLEEPRRLHLGTDVWGPAGTIISAPLAGVIHSFAFNNAFGDYGATIILQHQLQSHTFHTLYGHLKLNDLEQLYVGKSIKQGEAFAHFGNAPENGNWPPHLHFQIIGSMYDFKGDYPGVCKASEREFYLSNSPDSNLVLQLMEFAVA